MLDQRAFFCPKYDCSVDGHQRGQASLMHRTIPHSPHFEQRKEVACSLIIPLPQASYPCASPLANHHPQGCARGQPACCYCYLLLAKRGSTPKLMWMNCF